MTSLFEAFPLLERMYSPYETRFHPHDAETSPFGLTTHDFAENMWLPGVVAIAYYLGIAGSIKIMEHRKAFDLKFELAAWNFFLCVFSAVGAARTMPHLVYNVANYPMQRSLCGAAASDWGAGACGFWVQLFILSKFAELLDTAFIIARKKKLMFLHWYHHFSVHASVVTTPPWGGGVGGNDDDSNLEGKCRRARVCTKDTSSRAST